MVGLMAQSIPSVPIPPGHLSFSFGKAANAPRLGWAFIQKPIQLLKQGLVYKKEGPDSSKGSNEQ